MSDEKGLKERLRHLAAVRRGIDADGKSNVYDEAADTIDRLEAEVERLKAGHNVGETVGALSRYHFLDEEPVLIRTVDGDAKLGAGWLAISEDEYRSLASAQALIGEMVEGLGAARSELRDRLGRGASGWEVVETITALIQKAKEMRDGQG